MKGKTKELKNIMNKQVKCLDNRVVKQNINVVVQQYFSCLDLEESSKHLKSMYKCRNDCDELKKSVDIADALHPKLLSPHYEKDLKARWDLK